MEATSSSKITVEYHDLDGIFPVIAPLIQARLPLRNLNWHAPQRPLRQIKALHLDFVPDKETTSSLQQNGSDTASAAPSSEEIVRAETDVHKGAVKDKQPRRHQIPGLRNSPYLKLYILRCDDKEGYKEAQKKRIREWIKDNASAQGKRDDHDAYEWLILHVVLPDTAAASEPRWREVSTKEVDELKERKTGAKWPGKGSRTVFDRLRSDFIESSKSGFDRVAQIRPTKAQVPVELIPSPPIGTTLEETAQERENAWADLITKLKILILDPFNRRVQKYEKDVLEQDSRRTLPGWNFCTFFIHKEGLARALESIGLVEDASTIYDELSLDLETTLRAIATGEAQGTATIFAPYTNDIKQRVRNPSNAQSNGTSNERMNENHDAAKLFSKDYRELIVRSNISVFDFFCYLFLRQKNLILRLANARTARLELDSGNKQDGGEDLVLTSEVCWRASSFIHNAARALRQDLSHGPDDLSTTEIEGIVSSWIYAMAGLILKETAVPVFLDVAQSDNPLARYVQLPSGKADRSSFGTSMGANQYPQRTTSLAMRKRGQSELSQSSHGRPLSVETSSTTPSSQAGSESSKLGGLPGQAELATYRAELITMQRKMLEQTARQRGWYAGRSHIPQTNSSSLAEFDLQSEDDPHTHTSVENGDAGHKLQYIWPELELALQSESSYQDLYEQLTRLAAQHYLAATQTNSAHALINDLAMFKCQQGQFTAAIELFEHVIPLKTIEHWDRAHVECLKAYAICLKKVDRFRDYVRANLLLAARYCSHHMLPDLPRLTSFTGMARSEDEKRFLDGGSLLSDAIVASIMLTSDLIQPMDSVFTDIKITPGIRHIAGTDATALRISFKHLLEDEFKCEEILLRLVHTEDEGQVIWFRNTDVVTIGKGLNEVELQSHTNTIGRYHVNRIEVAAAKVRFIHHFRAEPGGLSSKRTSLASTAELRQTPSPISVMHLYPSPNALQATVRTSREIHISQRRNMEVVLATHKNEISNATIRLKALVAGLRLFLSNAEALNAQIEPGNDVNGAFVLLSNLDSSQEILIKVPYTLEHASDNIAFRLEVEYETGSGKYLLLDNAKIAHELPLDVDVKDVFHLDSVISNFTLRTTGSTPFSIFDAKLLGSAAFEVQTHAKLPRIDVFQAQAGRVAYKITRKPDRAKDLTKRDAALTLCLRCLTIDALIEQSLQQTFLKALQDSPFSTFARLLTFEIVNRVTQELSSIDLEVAIQLGEFQMPSLDSIKWHEVTYTLAQDVKGPLLHWLQEWHASHPRIPLLADEKCADLLQSITLSVDLPSMEVVFATSLHLKEKPDRIGTDGPILKAGDVFDATVRIRHTSTWSARGTFPSQTHSGLKSQQDLTYVCEVSDPSDAWVIGGQRRTHFDLGDGKDHHIRLSLIPMKIGIQRFPHVDIRGADIHRQPLPSNIASGSIVEDDAAPQSLESHYMSAGRLVQVIRDVHTVRVQIPDLPALASVSVPSTSRPGTASGRDVG